MSIHVIPLKNSLWRVVPMTSTRADRWSQAHRLWWNRKGHRLSISPEMWVL